jgi:hypothetical protein
MNSNQKLVLAILGSPLLGAAVYFLTRSESQGDAAVPTQVASEAAPEPERARLRDPSSAPNPAAEEFMDQRWGHLGDSGMVTAHVDEAGETFYVEPRIFRGRDAQGNPIYMRAYAQMERIENPVKLSGVEGLKTFHLSTTYDPGPLRKLAERLSPIDDPSDMPEGLEHEHPLSPNYQGPKSTGQ